MHCPVRAARLETKHRVCHKIDREYQIGGRPHGAGHAAINRSPGDDQAGDANLRQIFRKPGPRKTRRAEFRENRLGWLLRGEGHGLPAGMTGPK